MKKFLFVVVSLFLSLTFANANDLLFKASNGALNQNSLGVKKLTDDELRGVVGGYVTQGRVAPFLVSGGYWLAKQGAMWGIRYTTWGIFSERHPLNSGVGSKGWRY